MSLNKCLNKNLSDVKSSLKENLKSIFDNRIGIVTVQELSVITGFRPGTIYNWISREPDFPYEKWGKCVRFSTKDVFEWLQNRR